MQVTVRIYVPLLQLENQQILLTEPSKDTGLHPTHNGEIIISPC